MFKSSKTIKFFIFLYLFLNIFSSISQTSEGVPFNNIVQHESPKLISSVKFEAYNVARQYAKQNKCMVQYTSGNIETPEFPTGGPEEAL